MLELRPQSEEGVTYAEKIDPAERRLDPARSAWNAPCARSRPASVRSWSSRTANAWGSRQRAADAGVGPGAVVAEDGRLLVGCAEGARAASCTARGRTVDAGR